MDQDEYCSSAFWCKGDQFGNFFVPTGGGLAFIKLVHFYGYVTCAKRGLDLLGMKYLY